MEPLAETMADHDTMKATALTVIGWLLQLLRIDVATKVLTLIGLVLYVVYLLYSIRAKKLEIKHRLMAAPHLGAVIDDESEDPTTTAIQ